MTYMPNLWILREESGEIVGCVFAKVQSKEEDVSTFVYIGLLAVKVGNQVEQGCPTNFGKWGSRL